MRSVIDLAYRIRRRAMALVGWRTRGVKVVVFDAAGAILLIRNRYGRTDLWVLPGGGIARGETPEAAAIREVREETGCAIAGVTLLFVLASASEGRRDTVHLFRATTDDVPVADGVEVAAVGAFALDTLPDALSPATRRRIDELQGRRESTGRW